MCTLTALHRIVPGMPLVVAANRDEFFDRPSEGPSLRNTPDGVVLAPLDVREGGTWLGLNSHGLFAALTNRRTEGEADPGRRSRGLLVMDALAAESAVEAVERIEKLLLRVGAESRAIEMKSSQLKTGAYNPFNLFIADRERAFGITYLETPQRVSFAPGAHVIGNVALGEHTPKLARIERNVRAAAAAPAEFVLDRLAVICQGHDGGSLEAACVHTPTYGTRSSLLLALDDAGTNGFRSELRYAEGAPCSNPYEELTPLLLELGLGASFVRGETNARSVS